MATQTEIDRVMEIRRANHKQVGCEILFDLACQWGRGEKADYEYIAGRVAILAGLDEKTAWKVACENAALALSRSAACRWQGKPAVGDTA